MAERITQPFLAESCPILAKVRAKVNGNKSGLKVILNAGGKVDCRDGRGREMCRKGTCPYLGNSSDYVDISNLSFPKKPIPLFVSRCIAVNENLDIEPNHVRENPYMIEPDEPTDAEIRDFIEGIRESSR